MRRPKFRMCSIKNANRKKAQLRSLVVSVSRHLVNVSVTPGNLTISVVPKIQQLVVLLRTQGLKASWVVAAEGCHLPFARWLFLHVPHLLF